MWKRHPCRWTATVELSGRDAASTLKITGKIRHKTFQGLKKASLPLPTSLFSGLRTTECSA
jgi:hypothetical protein